MITEDYVSFETAKLLKENGFDGFCTRYYQADKEDVNGEHTLFMFASDLNLFCTVTNSLLNNYADKNDETILAPTFQMAMKWLREVHNIDITATPDRKAGYSVLIFKDKKLPFDTLDSYFSYEQACEAAIKYCLENLI